jgi:uncharacterized protein (TIGR02996 family)
MSLNDETFIAAILADPQEEANWLVYADWLEERGDPRAELYRRRRLTNNIGMEFVLVPRGSANGSARSSRGRAKNGTRPAESLLPAGRVTVHTVPWGPARGHARRPPCRASASGRLASSSPASPAAPC